jgi:hypothetical protein
MRGLRILSIGLLALAGLTTCGSNREVAPAETFCKDLLAQGCVRAFECVPPADRNNDFYIQYGTTLEECSRLPNRCTEYPAQCPNFDEGRGATCLSDFTTQTCLELLIIVDGVPVVALPTSCDGRMCPP